MACVDAQHCLNGQHLRSRTEPTMETVLAALAGGGLTLAQLVCLLVQVSLGRGCCQSGGQDCKGALPRTYVVGPLVR